LTDLSAWRGDTETWSLEKNMSGDFNKKLAGMNDAWNNAPKNTNLQEGIYTFTIQEAKLV
jgi:hypothetical protein